jgi:hypothetical protein
MNAEHTGPQQTGPSLLGNHPLDESEPHSQDDTPIPEAADWLKNPEDPKPTPVQLEIFQWTTEPEWTPADGPRHTFEPISEEEDDD